LPSGHVLHILDISDHNRLCCAGSLCLLPDKLAARKVCSLISIYLQGHECLRVNHDVSDTMSRSDQQTEPRPSFAHLFSKAKSTCNGHRKAATFCIMSPISWKEQDITRL